MTAGTVGAAILLIHAAATLFMVGVIWFVQIVHYPLFALANHERFTEYARRNQRLTTCLLALPMVVELVTAIILAGSYAADQGRSLAWTGLALLALIWISTVAVQLPQHRRLSRGFDADVQRRLVYSNWPRTAAWTARGIIAMAMIATRPVS